MFHNLKFILLVVKVKIVIIKKSKIMLNMKMRCNIIEILKHYYKLK